MAAAVRAGELGAKVIVLEKLPESFLRRDLCFRRWTIRRRIFFDEAGRVLPRQWTRSIGRRWTINAVPAMRGFCGDI